MSEKEFIKIIDLIQLEISTKTNYLKNYCDRDPSYSLIVVGNIESLSRIYTIIVSNYLYEKLNVHSQSTTN